MVRLTVRPNVKCNVCKETNMGKFDVYMIQNGGNAKKVSAVYASQLKEEIKAYIREQSEKRKKETAETSGEKLAKAFTEAPEASHSVNGKIVKSFKTVCMNDNYAPNHLLITNSYLPNDDLAPARIDATIREVYDALNLYLKEESKLEEQQRGDYEYEIDWQANQLIDTATNKRLSDGSVLDINKVKRTLKSMEFGSIAAAADKRVIVREQLRAVTLKGKYIHSIELRILARNESMKDENGKTITVSSAYIDVGNVTASDEARLVVAEIAKHLPTDRMLMKAIESYRESNQKAA